MNICDHPVLADVIFPLCKQQSSHCLLMGDIFKGLDIYNCMSDILDEYNETCYLENKSSKREQITEYIPECSYGTSYSDSKYRHSTNDNTFDGNINTLFNTDATLVDTKVTNVDDASTLESTRESTLEYDYNDNDLFDSNSEQLQDKYLTTTPNNRVPLSPIIFDEFSMNQNADSSQNVVMNNSGNSTSGVFTDSDNECHSPNLKPAKSYIALIGEAILSSPDSRMILKDIYEYVLTKYPYYRRSRCAWRNSIRHNLSVNDCFCKSSIARTGRGYYWSLHEACISDFKKGEFNRRVARTRVQNANRGRINYKKAVTSPTCNITPPCYVTMTSTPSRGYPIYDQSKLLDKRSLYVYS